MLKDLIASTTEAIEIDRNLEDAGYNTGVDFATVLIIEDIIPVDEIAPLDAIVHQQDHLTRTVPHNG